MEDEYWYFAYLKSFIDGDSLEKIDYSMLLTTLFRREFVPTVYGDTDRSADGIMLRKKYKDMDDDPYDRYRGDVLDGKPCSMLEMMVALSVKCEEGIAGEPGEFDSARWFWGMIDSLGLSEMKDDDYSTFYVEHILDKFANHSYKRNGEGGLFRIDGVGDVRKMSIWKQMCLYLDHQYGY